MNQNRIKVQCENRNKTKLNKDSDDGFEIVVYRNHLQNRKQKAIVFSKIAF